MGRGWLRHLPRCTETEPALKVVERNRFAISHAGYGTARISVQILMCRSSIASLSTRGRDFVFVCYHVDGVPGEVLVPVAGKPMQDAAATAFESEIDLRVLRCGQESR